MSIVVGHDLSELADAALAAALGRARERDDDTVYVVHVVSQVALDATGELVKEEKRRAALERFYPEVWKRVRGVAESTGEEDADLDVQIRFAPVHLTRLHRRVAQELLQVAVDYGADTIVLGRAGRPGSVVEVLLETGQLVGEASAKPMILRAKSGQLDLPPSESWSGGPARG